jgi:AAA domain
MRVAIHEAVDKADGAVFRCTLSDSAAVRGWNCKRYNRAAESMALASDFSRSFMKAIRVRVPKRLMKSATEILGSDATWTDRDGTKAAIGLDDILIIAPYNAQVFELQERMPGARIGTVDKFQGQEAPIVIYSMTTSSHADAPRGMEFLYSSNRLNVATSRAKCVCVLVGSPLVFEAECRTPRHMQLANAFCRYLEMATTI